MPLTSFHPAVAHWFNADFKALSDAQRQAWPAIRAGESTLIAAPTGSGKTLAAFLAAIDQRVQQGLEAPLPDETRILYISPLKALSKIFTKTLELPLNGIRFALLECGLPDVAIRAQTRTGDTPAQEHAAMKRHPPHILVTTPESLYICSPRIQGATCCVRRAALSPMKFMRWRASFALAGTPDAIDGNAAGAHRLIGHAKTGRIDGAISERQSLNALRGYRYRP